MRRVVSLRFDNLHLSNPRIPNWWLQFNRQVRRTDNWGKRMTTDSQRAALERLIRVAQGRTGQSRVADFLLAWWNAEECGGFALTDVWGVDTAIAEDMLQVFALVAAWQHYSDTLGYRKQFEAIIRAWRPDLSF